MGSADLDSAETIVTPRSKRAGAAAASGAAPVAASGRSAPASPVVRPGAGRGGIGSGGRPTMTDPDALLDVMSDVGHAETVSGHSPTASPGGGADQVRVAAGTLLGKRYRIGEHLGSGGMGTVYAAQDLLVDQTVALKFVRPSLASDHRERERLRHEVRLAQSVTHVNVARTYTLDEIDGHLFIVMELLSGPTLSARLKQGRLTLEDAVRIAADLLQGLAAAHGRGILHRDIKPGNVKLVDDGRAVIMDFGMARASETPQPNPALPVEYEKLKVQITHTLLGGTPGYIAPEILRGRRGDARADLYSFGVMFFEMLAGRAPFCSATPQELLIKHLDEQPDEIATFRPDVPPHIATLVARLLAKDPEERPHSADAVRRDLLGLPAVGRASGAIAVPGSSGPMAAVSGSMSAETPKITGQQDVAAAGPQSQPRTPRFQVGDDPTTARRGEMSLAPRRKAWWLATSLVIAGGLGWALWRGMAGGGAAAGGAGGGVNDPRERPSIAAPPARPPAAPGGVPADASSPVSAPERPAVISTDPPDAGPDRPGGKPGGRHRGHRTDDGKPDIGQPDGAPARTKEPKEPDAAEKRRRQLELED